MRPAHPLISHVPVPPLDPGAVRRLDPTCDRAEAIAALRVLSEGLVSPQRP